MSRIIALFSGVIAQSHAEHPTPNDRDQEPQGKTDESHCDGEDELQAIFGTIHAILRLNTRSAPEPHH